MIKKILKIKKSKLKHARIFGNTSRFIDGLIAINDGVLFEKSCIEKYLWELELKEENKNNTEITFLDLFIIMINKKQIHLFDKRDPFPF